MFSILDVWNPGEGPGGRKYVPTEPSGFEISTPLVVGISLAVVIIVAVVVVVVLKNKNNDNNK